MKKMQNKKRIKLNINDIETLKITRTIDMTQNTYNRHDTEYECKEIDTATGN